MEFVVVGSLMLFGASVFIAIVTRGSLALTRRYSTMKLREVMVQHPPKLTLTAYGRAWPYARKAVVITGLAACVALLAAAVVAALS